MLKRVLSHGLYNPFTIECRQISSHLAELLESALLKASAIEEYIPIENGSTRFWELRGIAASKVCIGGMAPIKLEPNYPMYNSIDFSNEASNMLHVELIDCPKLLALKLTQAYPSMRGKNLRMLNLSYHKYSDKIQGKFECTIVANDICKQLNEFGFFSLYSGNVVNDPSILMHINYFVNPNSVDIHARVSEKNGYLDIYNLAADDVGTVYTDDNFDLKRFRRWILRRKY